jgi:hypothetical protein
MQQKIYFHLYVMSSRPTPPPTSQGPLSWSHNNIDGQLNEESHLDGHRLSHYATTDFQTLFLPIIYFRIFYLKAKLGWSLQCNQQPSKTLLIITL